jgi:Protein of unknown function (DUF4238)
MTQFPFDNYLDDLFEVARLRETYFTATPGTDQAAAQAAVQAYLSQLNTRLAIYPELKLGIDQVLAKTDAASPGSVHEARHHHVVPQLYLRHFQSKPGGPSEQIWAWDKTTQTSSKEPIKRVTTEYDFYSLSSSNVQKIGGPQVIEFVLSRLENAMAVALHNVVTARMIEQKDRPMVALFAALQSFRNRAFRDYFSAELGTQASDPAADHAALLMSEWPRKVAIVLSNQYWVIGTSTAGNRFYTSDTPVVGLTADEASGESPDGLIPSGMQLDLPLSPTVLIRIFERQHFAQHRRADGSLHQTTLGELQFSNMLQVCQSDRLVLADADDFAYADQALPNCP